MYKLVYGLIFNALITPCLGQAQTGGFTYALEAGLSGQFFLRKKVDLSIPTFLNPATDELTSVGMGAYSTFALYSAKWGLEVTPTVRYPLTKKWLVQRAGFDQVNERKVILDLDISITRQFVSNIDFFNNSRLGLGLTVLNLNGNFSGTYGILINNTWETITYQTLRMIGPHIFFKKTFFDKLTLKPMVLFIPQDQIQSRPNVSYYLFGHIAVGYNIYRGKGKK